MRDAVEGASETRGDRRVRSWRSILDGTAALAMTTASVAVIWVVVLSPAARNSGRPAPSPPVALPAEPVSLVDANVKGDRNAKVAVIEYSDFQCPYCGAFVRDSWPAIVRAYVTPGRVLFAFRHLPLEKVHPFAMKAAEAAECAGRQGKFWEMHDQLFENPRQLEESTLRNRANLIGLAKSEFQSCLEGEAMAKVQKDVADAQLLGITGTPTFLFGVVRDGSQVRVMRRLTGSLPFETVARVLDELLKGTKSW